MHLDTTLSALGDDFAEVDVVISGQGHLCSCHAIELVTHRNMRKQTSLVLGKS